jgi:hypothetical protein
MADKKEYSIRQARRDAADFLGVRDATTRATKDARDYSAQTKQDDSYEDTLRHILLGGLIKNVPGQENNMGKTIASKFINTKLMESDGKESEIDINNNKYGSRLRDRLIDSGDSSEEGFIKAAKAAVEQMKLQDFEDKSEGTSPRRSTEGRREIEMKTGGLAKQMELFEPVERGFNDGGLMDEGGTVDPVSGNDVPPGSTQEEVRDDIPAQLSEGEFVFPADVVRYIGLENLMRMRQEAKMGLAQMEEMGQMGNSEEATMPDDLPFDMYDLEVEDDGENNDSLRMNVGGMVPTYNPQTGTYSMPGTGIGGFQPSQQTPNTGYTPYTGTQPYMQPLQYTGTQYTTADQTTNIPTFGQMVGSGYQGSELRTYVNDAGQVLQIAFVDGKPVYPIPDGYRPQENQPKQEQPVTQLSGPTTTVTDRDDKGPNMTDVTTPSTSVGTTTSTTPVGQTARVQSPFQGFDSTTEAYGGNVEFGFSNDNYKKAIAKQGMYQAGSFGVTGAATALGKGIGFLDSSLNDMAIAGHTGKTNTLEHMGMINTDQMMSNAQADLVAEAINAAHAAAKAGENVDAAISGVLSSTKAKQIEIDAYEAMKKGYENYLNSEFGPDSDTPRSDSLPRSMLNGGTLSNSDYAKSMENVMEEAQAELDSIEAGEEINGYKTRAMSRNVKTGLMEPIKNAYTKAGSYYKSLAEKKRQQAKIQRDKANGREDRGFSHTSGKSAADFGKADVATGKGGGVRSEDLDASFGGGVRSEDRDAAVGKEDNSASGSSSGGPGCFAAGTKFFMQDGSLKSVENIKVGDTMMDGGKVRLAIIGDGSKSDWYMYGTTKVTGTHPVREQGVWKFTRNAENATPAETEDLLYTITNENHRMVAEDKVVYSDYDMVDEDGIEEELLEMMNLQEVVEEAA